jgi:predicted transposase/invertase (TIGR01784 family)
MAKLKYTLKNDALFKMLFVKYPDLLKWLVAELLEMDYGSIEQFDITNPEMLPETMGDKFCRLDINMMVDGKRVDLEIQVRDEGDYPERSLFYWARDYSTALAEGDDYSLLPRTIIISIVNFTLFGCTEFYSEFQALEVTRHIPLTDKMSLHYYELPKLPALENTGHGKELWLTLFKAETEEEIAKIEALEVPIMNQALGAYRHVSASPEFREIERLRSKARHDEAQALKNAEKRGAETEREKWESEREKWQVVVASKDAEVAAKDAEVTAKDAENETLRKQLAELQARLEGK